MHKPVILLTKAYSKEQALARTYNFMKDYENKVFDWYVIGGRWHNTLAPRLIEWNDFVKKYIYTEKGKKDQKFVSSNVIKAKLQQSWRDLGMLGKNPHSLHFDLPPSGNYYDVMPLKDCLQKVSSWTISNQKIKEKFEKDLKTWKDETAMIKYLKKLNRKQMRGEFTDDRNVFNIDLHEAETIPVNFTEYFAVMVDMHM